ncbi:hypothetical protein [Natrialba aegyptia]|uniref:Uncharacterized protein n=1 Tax=Natrialba aegyptia DSM 13077 TaxID=1227491 RepID=M0B3E7_9EURY|nr:hypothetical protein [Natrialba aegyptia]ELZ05325.1 hypothetical protein C480_10595 [Natrialba aegyptia DSM 13077]
MSTDSAPNTKFAPVPMPVPRDPSEFRATAHFSQRLRERVPSALRDRVVRECIESGFCRGASPPDSIDSDDQMVQAFAFDQEVEGVEWTVVVGIMRDAYLRDGAKHKAITVYPGDDDE